MPPVIPAIVAGASLLATGGTFLGVAGIGGALLAGVSSLALSFLSSALTPKPKNDVPDLSSFGSFKSTGSTQQFRQPITERRSIYGEIRTSGPIVFIAVSDDNRYLHMVVALGSHEFQEIGEIFINDTSIAPDHLDGSNLVNTGRYSGLIKIKKFLGTAGQTADADLMGAGVGWTSNHRLRGISGIYVRLEWNRDAFPSGIPNVSAWCKGKKCLDTRTGTTYWTPNMALMARDYLTDTELGIGALAASIDTTELGGAANESEEFVTVTALDCSITAVDTATEILTLGGDKLEYQTGDKVQLVSGTIGGLSGSTDYYVIVYQRKDTPRIKLATSLANAIAGTAINLTSGTSGTLRKMAEPRYFGGGILKASAERGNNLIEMLGGFAGQAVFAGGVWRILAGSYQTPTISLGVSDLAGPIELHSKVSRRDRFNRVQGVYMTPLNDGNPSDFPAVQNTGYQTEDGRVIKTDLNLSFTQRPHTAQRLAKIYLERMRQEVTFKAQFKLTAFKLQVGDNFNFTFARYGWSSKVFEVVEWRITTKMVDEVPVPVIEMTCRENASAVYDWNNGEETAVDPAPNTDLPNAWDVDVVGGFSLDSILVNTKELDRIYSVLASWDLSDNYFVVSGGKYEVEFRETTDTDFKSAGIVDGTVTNLILPALKPDVLYDVRIFAYNSLGAKSAEALIEDFLVGTSVTTNTEDWENESNARDTDDWESDTLPTEDFET